MPNINRFIRINIDNVDDIEKLFGIGKILAERIINYRTTHHYFHNPEDLAKVDGISLELANTISPQIDWQLPVKPINSMDRDWEKAIYFFIGVLIFTWMLKSTLMSLDNSINELQMGIPNAWVLLIINSSSTIVNFSGILLAGLLVIENLSTNLLLNRRLDNGAFFLVGVCLIGLLVFGIGHGINYSLNDDWQILLTTRRFWLGIILFVMLLGAAFPSIIIPWRPALATNLFLARLFDILIILSLVALVWVSSDLYQNQPLWISVLVGILGLGLLRIGLTSMRSGYSYYFEIANSTILLHPRDADLSFWKKWINARLPDPEQQRALKKALEEMHPPSRFNTYVYAVVFGAGGWLFLTALSAVIQWFIENVLNKYFG